MDFVKLSELKEITIKSVGTPIWKKWLQSENKYEVSTAPRKRVDGFVKYYPAQSTKGKIDLTSSQLTSMLEAAFSVKEAGISDIRGATFEIIAVPKEIEIRGERKTIHNYYFNFRGYIKDNFEVEDINNALDEINIDF